MSEMPKAHMPNQRAGRRDLTKTQYVIRFPGDNGGEATPVPIPNTAVKLSCADGTAVYCGRVGRCQDFLFSGSKHPAQALSLIFCV